MGNKILNFDIPKKLRSAEKHNKTYQSYSSIAGTYVPNMSKVDMKSWKAKHIKGIDERIEIRKSVRGVQLLLVVYKKRNDVIWESGNWHKRHQDINISMNGKLDMTFNDFLDMEEAVKEAIVILM